MIVTEQSKQLYCIDEEETMNASPAVIDLTGDDADEAPAASSSLEAATAVAARVSVAPESFSQEQEEEELEEEEEKKTRPCSASVPSARPLSAFATTTAPRTQGST